MKTQEEIERARQLFIDLAHAVDYNFPDQWFGQIMAAQGAVLEWVLDQRMGELFDGTLQNISQEIELLKAGMIEPEDLKISNRPE